MVLDIFQKSSKTVVCVCVLLLQLLLATLSFVASLLWIYETYSHFAQMKTFYSTIGIMPASFRANTISVIQPLISFLTPTPPHLMVTYYLHAGGVWAVIYLQKRVFFKFVTTTKVIPDYKLMVLRWRTE